ncbi:P-loop containing nucleoside triphosphate hydrolase protein [Peniophora sp. CONT]|nr:P-loop containing nucleoside triphosphate hydrolase protein [Peniophora sp. CONT]
MTSFAQHLTPIFGQPATHETYLVLKSLYEAYPTSRHVVSLETHEAGFPLFSYLKSIEVAHTFSERDAAGNLSLDSFTIHTYDGASKTVAPRTFMGKASFEYEGVAFTAYKAAWQQGFHGSAFFIDLVFNAADDEPGKRLAAAVYAYAAELKDEIWVYHSECWNKDKDLYAAIQAANWDDIVLGPEFKENLKRDMLQFFDSKAIYESLGITWKRGILLLGSPGNGKTESIKALLKETPYPALYVKSFTTQRGPEAGVRSIFAHARKHAPCVLVIEDLDAMVTPAVRSFFLNELDGIAANHGILTISTTNHPERIDDAIVNRPSRFDVKYTYALPDAALRRAFAEKWIGKVAVASGEGDKPKIQFTNSVGEVAEKVAVATEGFSFAFLKELFLSFLLAYAHAQAAGKTPEAPEEMLMKQIEFLSTQMIKTESEDSQDKENEAGMPRFVRARAMNPVTAQARLGV